MPRVPIKVLDGVKLSPTQKKIVQWAEYSGIPGLYVTSGLRNSTKMFGAWDHHEGGEAVDIAAPMTKLGRGRMKRLAAWMYRNSSKLLELIHDVQDDLGGGDFSVKNGDRVDGWSFYGPQTMGGHGDHVHVAAYHAQILALLRQVGRVGTAAPAGSKPARSIAQQAPVSFGVSHDAVFVLQRALNKIFRRAQIPVTGHFGEKTLYWVNQAQKLGKLPQGSTVDRGLWEYLAKRYNNAD